MSSNTATGTLASNVASDGAGALRRKAAEKCQLVLSTLRDSYDGYKQCVADTKDAAMRLLFDKIAESRADFISQLSNAIRVDLGVEPYVILILFSYQMNISFLDFNQVQLLQLHIEHGLMLKLGLLMVEINQPLLQRFIVVRKLLLHYTNQL
jgi:hypothetical protein